ncbi:MAG: hypothetical protein HQM13_08690 [SAR324 cluster bacterium]|nr:hypothetical protein [SAR324 cluster bacterium]
MIKYYKDDPDVAIVAVQTAFEGFKVNTFGGTEQVAKKYDLQIPIGQSGTEEEPSPVMKNYRTGGTPWVVIIDKEGIVRYNNFHIEAKYAIQGMEVLKKRPISQ